ncbi:MAG: CRISPR-associated endonuclease Cas1 [Xanthomonadales bacterium]|jgi:hypothetical protein|nr:CRISPR-associated endonuclease Cas1 [Xanthomonadales bacterium]
MTLETRHVLYLSGDTPTLVRLDGPALRIRQEGRSPMWMPLERISELVLRGTVSISAKALAAVLKAGAGIRVLDGYGQPMGELVRTGPGTRTWLARLDELLHQPDWRRSYIHWRLRQSIWDAASTFGRRLAITQLGRMVRPGQLARMIYAEHSAPLLAFTAVTPQLAADAMQLLIQQGWPRERWQQPYPGPNPCRDVVVAMRWEVLREMRQRPPLRGDDPALWYLQHRKPLLLRGRATLDSFNRWLIDRTGGE